MDSEDIKSEPLSVPDVSSSLFGSDVFRDALSGKFDPSGSLGIPRPDDLESMLRMHVKQITAVIPKEDGSAVNVYHETIFDASTVFLAKYIASITVVPDFSDFMIYELNLHDLVRNLFLSHPELVSQDAPGWSTYLRSTVFSLADKFINEWSGNAYSTTMSKNPVAEIFFGPFGILASDLSCRSVMEKAEKMLANTSPLVVSCVQDYRGPVLAVDYMPVK
jgi:hypothetical protein